jgi:glucose/mannose-6-phosphate isomerase
MNLNNYKQFSEIDRQNMLGEIEMLPNQLEKAWELGLGFPLPEWSGIRQVLVAGMGGSAIGADLLAAYAAAHCAVPIVVHRDYDLPAWGTGTDTLVILSSHSGNTEETLTAFQAASDRNCRILAVSTGGKIAKRAREVGLPLWQFEHSGQPRAAVGYSFTLLLAALFRLKLIQDPSADLFDAAAAMREQQAMLAPHIPVADNPAKRYAGQLVDRWSVVLGSGILAPVARRWKGQISEVAKAWAQFEYIPEANHNTLAGIENPEEILPRTMILFLCSSFDHPRNQLRNELTRKIFMLEGLGTDVIEAQGSTPLSQMWTCLHFGDYLAFYLAMSYEVDPTPVNAIEGFKEELKSAAG